jgi:hypothetical protein
MSAILEILDFLAVKLSGLAASILKSISGSSMFFQNVGVTSQKTKI